ncbi:MAG: NMD3-related protein [Candidatus Odinarchaeota archaeon]
MEPGVPPGGTRKCASCGADNAEFDNLCQECFLKDHPVILRRSSFKIPVCRECGNVYYTGSWSHPGTDKEEQLRQGVKYQIGRSYKFSSGKNLNIEIKQVEVTGIENGQDNVVGQFLITKKTDPFMPLIKLEESFEGRLKWRRCMECQTRDEVRFSAKLQFRFTSRHRLEDAMETFQDIITRYRSKNSLYKEQKAKGGFDIILSSKMVAREIAKHYQREIGATIKTTQEFISYDRYATKAITREITVIRYSDFLTGDLIEITGRIFQIQSYRQGQLHLFDFDSQTYKTTDMSSLDQANLAVANGNFQAFQVISLNTQDSSLVVMCLSSDDYVTFDLNFSDFPPTIQQGEDFRAAIYKGKIFFDHYSWNNRI